MADENPPVIDLADVWRADPSLAEWRLRCTEAMNLHTAETLALIRQHAVEIDLEGDKGGK